MRRPVATLLVVGVLAAAALGGSSDPPKGYLLSAPTGTSVLLIVTDDQRWDTLWAMPEVRRLLVDRGMTFRNAVVSNPLCCPSRATILTGDLSHTTGVYRVDPPFGGFVSFDDRSTLATRLDAAGYATGLFGKYLDAYQSAALAGYVPPGWDRWVAPVRSGYTDVRLTVDGTVVVPPSDAYATDLLGAEAEAFIRRETGPVFVVYAPPAPHEPATPAPGDESSFAELPPWAPPSFDRVSGASPVHMRDLPPVDRVAVETLRRNQYASLQAVDRQVAHLIDALGQTGRLDDALIVFTSDNGLLWGEHRWTRKEVPYEESIRVPLVIRGGGAAAGVTTDALASNADLAPTVADVVGLVATGTDGVSLAPVLRNPSTEVQGAVVLEHMEGTNPVPTYCGVRTADAKLIRYATGEEELFDLTADPYELKNIATTSPRRDELATMLEMLCRPGPPGWFESSGSLAIAVTVSLAVGLGVTARHAAPRFSPRRSHRSGDRASGSRG